ncbi:MAG: histidinol dehydrogenase, partial [Gemmatimonadetes bacterium]
MSQTIERTRWKYTGSLAELSGSERTSLLRRNGARSALVSEQTEEIVRRVRLDGDRALREMARAYDGVSLDSLEVPRAAQLRALAGIDRSLRAALERAARNIEMVHSADPPRTLEVETEPGVIVGRRP